MIHSVTCHEHVNISTDVVDNEAQRSPTEKVLLVFNTQLESSSNKTPVGELEYFRRHQGSRLTHKRGICIKTCYGRNEKTLEGGPGVVHTSREKYTQTAD